MRRKKKNKLKLTETNELIKKLVKRYGRVMLEVYQGIGERNLRPYAMRHIYSNGTCKIRYWDENGSRGFRGRKKQDSCFVLYYLELQDYFGQQCHPKTLDNTLKAMQMHDERWYKVKKIYAGNWIYEL